MKKTFLVLTAAVAMSCSSPESKNNTVVAGEAKEAPSNCSRLTAMLNDLDKNGFKSYLGDKDNGMSGIEEYKVKNNLPEFSQAAINVSPSDVRYSGMNVFNKDKASQINTFNTIKGKYAECLKGYTMTDNTNKSADKLPNILYTSPTTGITVTFAVADMGGEYAVVMEMKKKN